MSAKAFCWALDQRTDNPYAQCILLVLGDAADGSGIALIAPDDLAEKSRQKPATVSRHLRELEQAGALTRQKLSIEDGPTLFRIGLRLDQSIRMAASAEHDSAEQSGSAAVRPVPAEHIASLPAGANSFRVESGGQIFVEGSDILWPAWTAVYRCLGYREIPRFKCFNHPKTNRWGAELPSELPTFIAGAPVFSESVWWFTEKGSRQWWAWQKRIDRELGPVSRQTTRRRRAGGVEQIGAWFPSEWPPALLTGQHEDQEGDAA